MSTIPDNVLSQITMVGPETAMGNKDTGPLWIAELATPYSGAGQRPTVAKRPALSTLFERHAPDEVNRQFGGPLNNPKTEKMLLRQPVLMRAQVVAKSDRHVLKLWSSRLNQYREGSLLSLAETEERVAVLAPRAQRWADQPAFKEDHAWVPEIGVPPLRLVEGRIALGLVVDAQPLPRFLQLVADPAGKGFVLGGLNVELLSLGTKKVLPIELTPQGIEFEALLPDPTFDFNDPPQGDGTIKVIVRLEDNGQCGFWLRLVGCQEQSTLDGLERRLASALSQLGEGHSPLAVRFDVRPTVPSIRWRLNTATTLAFDGGLASGGEAAGLRWLGWHALLDPAGLDLRVVTRQRGTEVARDVAQIGVLDVALSRIPTGRNGDATLSLRINSAPSDDLSTHGPQAELAFTRFNKDKAWTPSSTFNGGLPAAVSIDLDLPLQGLDPLNRAARVIEAQEHTPAMFLLMRHGWLQAEVPAEAKESAVPSQEGTAGPAPASARRGSLTGHLVVGPSTGRSIAIESAVHATVTVEWKIDFDAPGVPEASQVQVSTWGTQGRLSGYLFYSEAAPSEEEMLPTLQGGSATLRDLRVDFGAPRRWGRWWSGRMAIAQAKADSAWRLELDLPTLPTGPRWIAWLHEARLPVISNVALTRAAQSSGRPSVSRDLLPVELGPTDGQPGKLVLQTDGQSSLPLVGCDGETHWFDPTLGKDKQKRSLKPTLLMPTLLGIELQPSDATPLPPLAGTDAPRPLSPSLQARWRLDLPQLDELMASVEVPRKPAATPPPTPVKTTALHLDLLASAWQKARDRLALAITDGADATEWAATLLDGPPPSGALVPPPLPPKTVVSHLVEPFTWRTPFGVCTRLRYAAPDGLSASLPLGSYSLAGVGYSLEQAALGMGTADLPVHFGISNKLKDIETGDAQSPIHVTGLAAALYRDQGADFDSRGFGLLPKAKVRSGLSVRGALSREAGKAPKPHWLVTLMQTLHIKGKDPLASKLGLFIRDLPMKDQDGVLTFEGEGNDCESLPGTEGTAFSPSQLPFSLHEWRLFALNDKDDATGLYALGWGPLAFTPLRLQRLTLEAVPGNAEPKLRALEVIGKLSLADGPDTWPPKVVNAPGPHAPFGPDEVYRPGDLFKLSIDEHAAFRLAAVDLATDPNTHRLLFSERPDGMVEIRTPATLAGHADVPISLNLVPKPGGDAELRARLFGFARALKGSVQTLSPDLIQVQFKATPSPTACLRVDGITATLSRDQGRWKAKLEIEVAIALLNEANEPLFEREGNGRWRWLNLPWQQERAGALKIDHTTGRVEWLVDHVFQPKARQPQLEPLAGLTAAAFTVRGVVAMAAPEPLQTESWPQFESGATALQFEMQGHEAPVTPHAPTSLTGLGIHHTHRGEEVSGPKGHDLRIDWTATRESSIHWPVESVSFAQPISGEHSSLVQLMRIAATPQALTHTITLALRGHGLPSSVLGHLPGTAQPARCGFIKPWRFLATVRHKLGGEQGAIEWTSLDHVTVMPAKGLVLPPDDPYVYAARYQKGTYRTKKASAPEIIHPGVARRILAETGFADQHLQAAFAAQDIGQLWDPVMLGGSATLFANHGADDKHELAVVPWLTPLGLSDSKLPRLSQCDPHADLQWRISLADALAARPMVTQRSSAPVILSAGASSVRIEQDLRKALAISDPATTLNHLPVEQAYFELFDPASGKVVPMDGQSASTVPYFPLALAVLHAVWQRHEKQVDSACLFAATGLQSKAVRVQLQSEEAARPVEGSGMVPIDLYVVSRDAVHAVPEGATTRRPSKLDSEVVTTRQHLARLRDLATRAAGEPVAIIVRTQRTVDPADGHLFESIDPPPAIDDFGAPAQGGAPKPSLPPSPAFGWPSADQTGNLGKFALTVGQESPVLSQTAGLAGRGLALGLPAWAAPTWAAGGTGPEAMYLSFADHVVFQRPATVRFRGPAARHLVPAPTRLRAPLSEQQAEALAMLASNKDIAECAPILPPRLERTTIGDRPGVFHAMTASVVVPTEDRGFDDDQPGFARPASSGPVIVHQFRAPRSPALPDDQDLALRRRTYISEADTTRVSANLKRYASFCALDRPAEIFRAHHHGDWRFTLVHSPLDGLGTVLSPQWDGRLAITLESRIAPDACQTATSEAEVLKAIGLLPTSVPATLWVTLRIGAVAFLFNRYTWGAPDTKDNVTTRQATFTMAPEQLAGALIRLADAPADTPITLELQATPEPSQVPGILSGDLSKQKDGALAAGPPRHLALPLLRAAGTRPTQPVGTTTVAFGDPAYDRQLGSKALASTPDYHDVSEFVLILDRDKYDLGSTVHLAGGLVHSASQCFKPQGAKLELTLRRIPASDAPPDTPVEAEPLYASLERVAHSISDGEAYAIKLSSLRDKNGNTARLLPGDRLVFNLSAPKGLNGFKPNPRELIVQLTEEATIAPPPSVYSLLAIRRANEPAETSARIPLHASAPLPTRIEFPDLLRDLAKGYVRRRALFVWSWSQTEPGPAQLALLKLDRSGGVQLPRTMDDFIQI